MVLLSTMTGLNVAEMLGLRWRNVNLGGDAVLVGTKMIPPCCLVVRENCYRGERCSLKATSRRRAVPLPKPVREVLAAMKSRPEYIAPDDPVFSSSAGTPLNECNLMRRVIKPAAVALGMPWVSWHVFRHTHATPGEQAGMSLSDRQAQLGHADPRMTRHYTHSDLERRRPWIEKMAELLADQPQAVIN